MTCAVVVLGSLTVLQTGLKSERGPCRPSVITVPDRDLVSGFVTEDSVNVGVDGELKGPRVGVKTMVPLRIMCPCVLRDPKVSFG